MPLVKVNENGSFENAVQILKQVAALFFLRDFKQVQSIRHNVKSPLRKKTSLFKKRLYQKLRVAH